MLSLENQWVLNYNIFMNDNDKTLRIIKICSVFALAFVFIFTAIYSYANDLKYTYELTFLSNFSTGLFLLVIGILWLCNKSVPQFLFLDFTILLLIVFGVCMAFAAEFNFAGGFAFLHIVNPLLMLAFYFFFSNQSKVKWQFLFTILAMPSIYIIFALIFGATTGNYIYFFLDYARYGVGYTVLFILGIAVGLTAFGTGLYFLNGLIHKRILKSI